MAGPCGGREMDALEMINAFIDSYVMNGCTKDALRLMWYWMVKS